MSNDVFGELELPPSRFDAPQQAGPPSSADPFAAASRSAPQQSDPFGSEPGFGAAAVNTEESFDIESVGKEKKAGKASKAAKSEKDEPAGSKLAMVMEHRMMILVALVMLIIGLIIGAIVF